MKRVIMMMVAVCLMATAQAQEQHQVPLAADSVRTYFSLDIGAAFDNYGRLDNSHTRYSTEYGGFRITPDVCIKGHWGIRLDMGAGWSFKSSATGVWETPMHSIANVSVALAPYYRFNVRRWFFDLGIEAGCRFRLPYMNGEMSRYLMTLSVGVGANFRMGYMVNDVVGFYVGMNAERTVYDLLYATYYPPQKYTSGMLGASAGFVFRF